MTRNHFDIRKYKQNLRDQYRRIRSSMSTAEKTDRDSAIFERIVSMPQYQKAKALLCYVSMTGEIDTHRLIRHALAQGKTVAVPCCVDGTRQMHFYQIHSLDELTPRTFGVLEPDPEVSEMLDEFSGSVCILPGLSFDVRGYRLGYGGGYYDRFLSTHYRDGITIGVCYQACMRQSLLHGRFDVPCSYLVTETATRRIHRGRGPRRRRKKAKSP